jgi:hypothetical protein
LNGETQPYQNSCLLVEAVEVEVAAEEMVAVQSAGVAVLS